MNKQIEEMARAMCRMNKPCILCEVQSPCRMRNCAHLLYAEGYRKASSVAAEIMREVRQALLNMVLANSMGETYDIEKRFAEIEKKYESEGADGE